MAGSLPSRWVLNSTLSLEIHGTPLEPVELKILFGFHYVILLPVSFSKEEMVYNECVLNYYQRERVGLRRGLDFQNLPFFQKNLCVPKYFNLN
jgi:hypothetical protein